MRPFTVLLLALLATGALIVALLTLNSGEPERPVEVGPELRDSSAVSRPDARIEGRNEPAPAPAPIAPAVARTEDTTVGLSFSNLLTGRVLGRESAPVEKARITLRLGGAPSQIELLTQQFQQSAPRGPSYTTHTDARGEFQFRSLPPGPNYTVLVEHADYSRREVSPVEVPVKGERREEIQLQSGFLLRGRVLTDQGAPLADAQLVLDSVLFYAAPGRIASPEVQRTKSDEFGNYVFPNVSPGSRYLSCAAQGFGTAIRMNLDFVGAPDKPTEIDFRLQTGMHIAGRVLAPDRSPIVGATIEALNYDGVEASRGAAVSDSTGRFDVPDLKAGSFVLVATAPGFSEERNNRVEAGTTEVELVLSRQGCVQGRVVDGVTSEPLTSFQCAVRMVNLDSPVYGRALAPHDFPSARDGNFEICSIQQGQYVVQVTAPGYAPTFSESFAVTQGMTTPDIVVRMGRGATITGLIVDSKTGDPVVGATIATFDNGYIKNPFMDLLGGMVPRNTADKSARTDREGRFELEGLNPEVYQLQIAHFAHPTLILKDVRVADGDKLDLGRLELQQGASVRGTVYGADGAALAGARVSVRSVDDIAHNYEGRSGPDGRFQIVNCAAGNYEITAMRTTDAPFEGLIDMKNSAVSAQLQWGGEYTFDLYLGKR